MKIATTGELVRFTPRDQYDLDLTGETENSAGLKGLKIKEGGISYYFRVGSVRDKASFRSRLLQEGLRYWTVQFQLGLLASEIRRLIKADGDDWTVDDLADVDDYREKLNQDTALLLEQKDAHPIEGIWARIRFDSDRWLQMELERDSYWEQAGAVFCRLFLQAWDGLPGEPTFAADGTLNDASLDKIIPDHADSIALWQQSNFWGPSRLEAKNSGSPAHSDSSQRSLTGTAQANGSRRKAPGKRTTGDSSASAGQS